MAATRFNNLTYQKAQEKLRKLRCAALRANQAFFSGNHWQDGLGWVGPMPTDPAAAHIIAEIAKAFVSKNVVREVSRRHMAGVLGREPSWGFTVARPLQQDEQPDTAEQALIDEAEAALTTWWDERHIHGTVQDAVQTSLLAGHGPLRLFVPPDELIDADDGGTQVPAVGSLTEALDLIWLDAPDPTTATVETDRRSMQRIGLYFYQEEQKAFIELCYLDGEFTVLRVVRPGVRPGDESDLGVLLQLGGRMLIHDIARPELITEQVRQNQKLMNLALTMMSRNVVQGGFLERIVLNGQVPGRYEDDPDTAGTQRFVPTPFKMGAGTTNFIAGLPIEDEEGKVTGFTNPGVVYRDPVKVETFIQTKDAAYQNILEECNQVHIRISGDATASGASRIEAKADFIADLVMTASRVNMVGRSIIEAALALASLFAGQPGRYDGLRATFNCRINPGQLSADEMRVLMERVKEKLLSRESGLERMGEDDVDAELARIAAEAEQMNPVDQVNLERSRLALERDRQAPAAQTIQERLLAASQGATQPPAEGGGE